MIVPIVLLHYDEPEILLRSVAAIHERTNHPYRLFVVDNASPSRDVTAQTLRLISEKYAATVIHNARNNWIYGFNLALSHPNWPDCDLYAFSDADIIVPTIHRNGKCWLDHMVGQMNLHACIGKLGLGLELTNLKRNRQLRPTYLKEKKYKEGRRIGPNVIAPVDTTMALYRRDLFVTKFRFQIGHAALIKPHYYVCRTDDKWSANHVGWEHYPGAQNNSRSTEWFWRKALTFCWRGAYMDPAIVAIFPWWKRSILFLIRSSVRVFFGVKVAFLLLRYLALRFPRRLNEIQAECT